MEFTLDDGTALIKYARDNIIHYLETKKQLPIPSDLRKKFNEKMGAFVTLSKRKNDEKILRGCIGITQPIYPLIETISKMSLSSAFEDPRFPPVRNMDDVVIELSILTVPEKIIVKDPIEYLDKIRIGIDGLFIERGFQRGLLLPQVPIDNNRNWDALTFLQHLCMKAGLPTDQWKDPKTEIYAFQAIIFEEDSPNGEVHLKKN